MKKKGCAVPIGTLRLFLTELKVSLSSSHALGKERDSGRLGRKDR